MLLRPFNMVLNLVSTSSGEIQSVTTDKQKLLLEFWTMFREKLNKRPEIPSAQSPRPRGAFDVSLGRSNFFLSNFANTFDDNIAVRVYLSNRVAEIALPELLARKEEIEANLGEALSWNPNPDRKDKTIVLAKDANLNDRDRWDEYTDWLVDWTIRFRTVFAPIVKSIDLGAE